MSAETATLLGAVLGGTIGLAGSLIGLFGPRYFRTRGEIRLRTSRWEADQDPTAYTYKLSIYMFNEMEIDLSGARLALGSFAKPSTRRANLRGAWLEEAILKDATGFTQKQLKRAESLDGTIMPDGSKHP